MQGSSPVSHCHIFTPQVGSTGVLAVVLLGVMSVVLLGVLSGAASYV